MVNHRILYNHLDLHCSRIFVDLVNICDIVKREIDLKRVNTGTSLLAQWLRILLPTQRTRVQSLVQEDPTCCGATKPMCHNYWAWALEPASHNYWAHVPQLLKPTCLELVLHNEKPPQWEARTPQRRVGLAHRN